MNLRQKILLLIPEWLDIRLRDWLNLLRSLRRRDVRVEMTSGELRQTGERWSILIANRVTTIDYLVRGLINGKMECEFARLVAVRDLRHTIGGGCNANLAIIRQPRGQDCISIAEDCWRVPDAVLSVIDLAKAKTGVCRPGNSDNLRRIRKYRLYAQVTHDPNELSKFYHEAYVPHVRSRFGDLARPHSELTIIRAFKNGGLLWVLRNDVRYAGIVFCISGNVVRTLIAAPVNDKNDARRFRAVSATKMFMIDYAIENGFESLNLGKSRPNLLDGVLLHKKSWGAGIADDPDDDTELQLSWRQYSPAIASWLYTTPLVVREADGLSALTAIPENVSSDLCERHLNHIWCPGLSRINVLSGRSHHVSVTGGASIIWHLPHSRRPDPAT